jgi:4'-phosphopantetheinyl transferase
LGTLHNRFISNIAWQTTTPAQILDNEVHIYHIKISGNHHQADKFSATLDAAEIIRANKYFQPKDRTRFIISRGAQRHILSRYVNTAPHLLKFELGDNKKPYLLSNNNKVIHYNLSHSADCILLAIATVTVGLDVEYIDAAFSYHEILPEHFSQAEKKYTTSPENFFKLWTRKEAFLKATGQGLGEHLHNTPSLDGGHSLHHSLSGMEQDWECISFNIPGNYIASLVIPNGAGQYQFYNY